jgi:hypothetical protein
MDVYFKDNYDNKKIILIEANQQILDAIEMQNTNLIIKGDKDLTILATENKSYELKYLETSNSLLLLRNNCAIQNNSFQIVAMSDHVIEVNDVCPRKYSVINTLKSKCALKYDLKTGTNNINGKV